MSDEEFVRQHWVRAEDCPHDVNGSPKGVSISLGGQGFTRACVPDPYARSFSEAWTAAAEFTRDRLEQIRQIEEEIEYLNTQIAVSDYRLKQNLNDPYDAAWWSKRAGAEKRILSHEQDALTELKRGMRRE